jgi:hypothetical protein
MTTLAVRAPRKAAPSLLVRVLARVGAIAITALDVFDEAQQMALEAKRRYPFADL